MNRSWRRAMARRGFTPQHIERMAFRIEHREQAIEDTPYWRDIAKFGTRTRDRLVVDIAARTITTDTRPAFQRRSAA